MKPFVLQADILAPFAVEPFGFALKIDLMRRELDGGRCNEFLRLSRETLPTLQCALFTEFERQGP
jgi:hypothetical protein